MKIKEKKHGGKREGAGRKTESTRKKYEELLKVALEKEKK